MAVYYLNGTRFKHAIVAGTQAVITHQQAINDINVYPVADKDTGTNMAITFKAIAKAAQGLRSPSLGTVAKTIATTALMNARGNSGTIVAQFFHALSKELEGKLRISIEQFSKSVDVAVDSVRKTLINPAEGTILSVMQDWANFMKAHHHRHRRFDTLIPKSLEIINTSLKATRHKLAILEKSGVVDAGAQGFTYFMQGVVQYIQDGAARYRQKFSRKKQRQASAIVNSVRYDLEDHQHDAEIDFQYCTECVIEGPHVKLDTIRDLIGAWGNSNIVIGDDGLVKLHLHTNGPDLLFNQLNQHGRLVKTKVDDMWHQYRTSHGIKSNHDIALITDTSACLPQEFIVKHNVYRVPMQISFDDETYTDTITIHVKDFYKRLASKNEFVKTSQPTPADFLRVFQQARQHASCAVAIFVSSGLSGTVRAARLATELMPDFPIHIIDSKTIASSLGLVVQAAAKAIDAGLSIGAVVERAEQASKQNYIYASQQTLDYFIRGGRISKSMGKFAKFFNILPILGVDQLGKPVKAGFTFGVRANRKRAINAIIKHARSMQQPKFLIAEAHAHTTAEKIARQLEQQFNCESIDIVDAMPALGAHAGPGTISISCIDDYSPQGD